MAKANVFPLVIKAQAAEIQRLHKKITNVKGQITKLKNKIQQLKEFNG